MRSINTIPKITSYKTGKISVSKQIEFDFARLDRILEIDLYELSGTLFIDTWVFDYKESLKPFGVCVNVESVKELTPMRV